MSALFSFVVLRFLDVRRFPFSIPIVRFKVVTPLRFSSDRFRPIVVQYAGTGDHGFWRRKRLMALPMLRERGYSSVILENPFYGLRKPRGQLRSSLLNVSDLFVMGASLILESQVLFDWCEREGFGPLAAHGISMGGHMASLGASVWPKPIPLVPCLSWTSGSTVFTKGVLSKAIPWDLLSQQYQDLGEYRQEIRHLVRCEENAFQAGRDFAQAMEATFWPESDPDHGGIGQNSVAEAPSGGSGSQFLSSLVSSCNKIGAASLQLIPTKQHFLAASSAIPTEWFFRLASPGALRRAATAQQEDLSHQSDVQSVQHREAFQFMRGIMDECTHLKNYDVPVDPSLIILVLAEKDAYQPREGVMALPDIWPGCQTRFIMGEGHVSSYLFRQDVFREAIYDAVELFVSKYGDGQMAPKIAAPSR